MKKVLLDTNFLILIAKYKIHLFAELRRIMNTTYKVYTLSTVIDEIKALQKGKTKSHAALALKYTKKTIIKQVKGNVDNTLTSLANKNMFIATHDKELKKRVKARGAQIIFIRQKKYLTTN
jgi:rRNA-processing protein FCF1